MSKDVTKIVRKLVMGDLREEMMAFNLRRKINIHKDKKKYDRKRDRNTEED